MFLFNVRTLSSSCKGQEEEEDEGEEEEKQESPNAACVESSLNAINFQ